MLKRRWGTQGLITCGLLGALVGCSSSDGVLTPTPPTNQDADRLNLPTHTHSAIVTTEGAVISAGAAEVVIPRGALAEPVEIVVETTEGGFEAFPGAAEEQVLAFLPHGTQFLEPVTIRIPHTHASGDALALFTSEPDQAWTTVSGATFTDEYAQADVTHFSFFFASPVTLEEVVGAGSGGTGSTDGVAGTAGVGGTAGAGGSAEAGGSGGNSAGSGGTSAGEGGSAGQGGSASTDDGGSAGQGTVVGDSGSGGGAEPGSGGGSAEPGSGGEGGEGGGNGGEGGASQGAPDAGVPSVGGEGGSADPGNPGGGQAGDLGGNEPGSGGAAGASTGDAGAPDNFDPDYVVRGEWFGYTFSNPDVGNTMEHTGMCAEGFIAQDPELESFGAAWTWNIQQLEHTESGISWERTSNVIHYDISTTYGEPLQLMFLDDNFDSWCFPLTSDVGNVPVTSFRQSCSGGEAFEGLTPIYAVGITVPSNAESDQLFDFCINDLGPFHEVPQGGDAGAPTTPGSGGSPGVGGEGGGPAEGGGPGDGGSNEGGAGGSAGDPDAGVGGFAF